MTTTTAEDKALGLKILQKYFEGARSYYPFAVQYSFDEMVKTLESRTGGKNFVSGLGLAAALAEFDDDDIYNSMYALAKAAGGKIPSKNGDFYAYMVDQGTSIKFVDALVYTATESAKDVANGAVAIGDSLISTGKILTWVFPIAVLYFGYLYLNKKVK
jgi:hypothetical protein